MINKHIKIFLIIILLLGGLLRFYGINWDQGFHLHPDERAIIMTVERLEYPQTIEEFFSSTSTWNPAFFAYGSFPFYLLKFVGDSLSFINPEFALYSLLNIPGRILSGFFDLLTVIFVFKIGRLLFSKKVGLLAAFFYSISVLPIQLSHFYAVDTILTSFITITMYQLLLFYEKPSTKRAILIGIIFGLAVATKVSAVAVLAAIGMTLVVDLLIQLFEKGNHKKHLIMMSKDVASHTIHYLSLVLLVSLLTFAVASPYAIIDFYNFWAQTQLQSLMTKDPFTFPYTLQYVGKLPYLHEIYNIFMYGLGPFLGILTILGIIIYICKTFSAKNKHKALHIILLTFFLLYFAIVGNFTIGFVRYMLPLYPFFALFAAYGVYVFISYFGLKGNLRLLIAVYLGIASFTWTASFMYIYTQPNTRVVAADWFIKHVPPGSSIAVEHWDDLLPYIDQYNYPTQTLALYDSDSPAKWEIIDGQLAQSEFIIIASNRLYTPLQKLKDCESLPPGRCYEETAKYYEQLFNGELGFAKIAEFTTYPRVPILNTSINDQSADESFTVYDHPKIMIFQKRDYNGITFSN